MWLIVLCALLMACGQRHSATTVAEEQAIYYCPMHPEVVQDHPGKCAKCNGMELVKKDPGEALNTALRPTNASVLANIRTIKPETKEVALRIEATGVVDYDEFTKHDIASRLDGRIERLYVRYNYQPINAGDRVFDIYSPDLVTAEQNFIYVLNHDAGATDLVNAAAQKLKILGLTDAQINTIKRTRRAQQTMTIYSKWSGHIHEMNTGMTAVPGTIVQSSTPLSMKEGMYVMRGQAIFNVVDPHRVVVRLQIRSRDIGLAKVGQPVALELDETPKMEMEGKIDFIEPIIRQGAKTVASRVSLDNAEHHHKVGTLVKAVISAGKKEALWVPATAVVDLGKDKVVWLKDADRFRVQKIETGVMTSGWVEVLAGITDSDEIASEAHYLSDSEGFINANSDEE